MTLCFQFVSNTSAASAVYAAMTFASHIKTVWAKNYWMTFLWPWPKVMAVALINKNLFVCMIKWVPLTQSLPKFGGHIPLVMLVTWLNFGEILLETSGGGGGNFFSLKFRMCFFKVKHYMGHISEMKRKCISWILDKLYDVDFWPHPWPWPWIFHGQIFK